VARAGRHKEGLERGRAVAHRSSGGEEVGGELQELLDRISAKTAESRETRRWFLEGQARERGRAVAAYLGVASAGGDGGGREEAVGAVGERADAGTAAEPGADGAARVRRWVRRGRDGVAAHGDEATTTPQKESEPVSSGGESGSGGKRRRSGAETDCGSKRCRRVGDSGRKAGSGVDCGSAALGENKVTAQEMLAARMHAVVCEMRARQQRQADRKRVREAAAADGEEAPTAPNDVPRGVLRVAAHTIANFRKNRGQITNYGTPNGKGRKVMSPHILCVLVYP